MTTPEEPTISVSWTTTSIETHCQEIPIRNLLEALAEDHWRFTPGQSTDGEAGFNLDDLIADHEQETILGELPRRVVDLISADELIAACARHPELDELLAPLVERPITTEIQEGDFDHDHV